MTLEGKTTGDVERYFNSIQFKRPHGDKWQGYGTHFRRYLERCWIYAGYVQYNRNVKDNESDKRNFIRRKGEHYHLRIIDEREAEIIDKIVLSRKRALRNNYRRLSRYFSGVVYCLSLIHI